MTQLNSSKKYHSNCVLCGQNNPWSLGLNFSILNDGSVYGKFQAHEKLQGYDGILHGGVISALLDAAMTHSLFHQGVEAVTADLRIRFLRPVPCDSCLELSARVLSENSRLYIVKAEIFYQGKLMARSEAKFMPRSTSK